MFSNHPRRRAVTAILALAGVALTPLAARAQKQKDAKSTAASSAIASGQNTYEELFTKYLDQARTTPASPSSWMAGLMGDPRARHVNDLVTIKVVESLTATGAADANVAKSSKSDVGLPASPVATALSKVLPASSDTKFTGSGGTTRAGTMSAIVTGRVTEVLPNGDMVIEGVREIQVNADRQVVVLTGVIRAVDVLPGNIVSSASIGQLRIQCLGKGLIKDSLTPGWLVRFLNKVF